MNEFEEGVEHALMRAHRYKAPEVARGLHQNAQICAKQCQRIGNACMAHNKRLQAKYCARRAFGPFDQPMQYGDWVKIGDEQEQWAWRHA